MEIIQVKDDEFIKCFEVQSDCTFFDSIIKRFKELYTDFVLLKKTDATNTYLFCRKIEDAFYADDN